MPYTKISYQTDRVKELRRGYNHKYRQSEERRQKDRDLAISLYNRQKQNGKDPNRHHKQRREQRYLLEAGRPRPDICDVCNEKLGRIVFDHDHITGEFRGWLCDRCNKLISYAGDNAALLRMLAEYLETAAIVSANKTEEKEQ